MVDKDEELERLKLDVDLVLYAQANGYFVDDKESSPKGRPTHWVLRRNVDDDKILAVRKGDIWVYRSLRDPIDRGTVLDFAEKLRHFGRGSWRLSAAAVADLRRFLGDPGRPPPQTAPARPEAPAFTDEARAALVARFDRAKEGRVSRYLVQTRYLSPKILRDVRFAGAWREDPAGNVLFPHHDQGGLCGYDIRGRNLKIYSPGGIKGLWHSRVFTTDSKLVLFEGSIDALSYHQLYPDPHTRYMATGGSIGKAQLQLLERAIARMPPGSTVVIASDRDRGGTLFAEQVKAIAGAARIERHQPGAKDWNQELQDLTGRASRFERDR
jgi:hypothetical protein